MKKFLVSFVLLSSIFGLLVVTACTSSKNSSYVGYPDDSELPPTDVARRDPPPPRDTRTDCDMGVLNFDDSRTPLSMAISRQPSGDLIYLRSLDQYGVNHVDVIERRNCQLKRLNLELDVPVDMITTPSSDNMALGLANGTVIETLRANILDGDVDGGFETFSFLSSIKRYSDVAGVQPNQVITATTSIEIRNMLITQNSHHVFGAAVVGLKGGCGNLRLFSLSDPKQGEVLFENYTFYDMNTCSYTLNSFVSSETHLLWAGSGLGFFGRSGRINEFWTGDDFSNSYGFVVAALNGQTMKGYNATILNSLIREEGEIVPVESFAMDNGFVIVWHEGRTSIESGRHNMSRTANSYMSFVPMEGDTAIKSIELEPTPAPCGYAMQVDKETFACMSLSGNGHVLSITQIDKHGDIVQIEDVTLPTGLVMNGQFTAMRNINDLILSTRGDTSAQQLLLIEIPNIF